MGVSLARFAREVGVSAQAIGQAVKAGRLVSSILPDGTIDLERGKVEWAAISDPASRSKGTPGAADPLIGQQAGMARVLKSTLQAKILELEYRAKTGELVSAAEVSASAYEAGIRFREHLLSIAARLAPVLAGITDVGECYSLLETEMQQACDELSSTSFTKPEKAS